MQSNEGWWPRKLINKSVVNWNKLTKCKKRLETRRNNTNKNYSFNFKDTKQLNQKGSNEPWTSRVHYCLSTTRNLTIFCFRPICTLLNMPENGRTLTMYLVEPQITVTSYHLWHFRVATISQIALWKTEKLPFSVNMNHSKPSTFNLNDPINKHWNMNLAAFNPSTNSYSSNYMCIIYTIFVI